MKQATFIALATLLLGSTLAANYCGVGICSECGYFPILMEDRSCLKCQDGPGISAGSGTLAMKCDNTGKPAGCARLSSTKTCDVCTEGMNYTESTKTCAEPTTKVEN